MIILCYHRHHLHFICRNTSRPTLVVVRRPNSRVLKLLLLWINYVIHWYYNGGPQVTCFVQNFSLHSHSISTLLWLHSHSNPTLLPLHNFIRQEQSRSGVSVEWEWTWEWNEKFWMKHVTCGPRGPPYNHCSVCMSPFSHRTVDTTTSVITVAAAVISVWWWSCGEVRQLNLDEDDDDASTETDSIRATFRDGCLVVDSASCCRRKPSTLKLLQKHKQRWVY